MLKVQAVPLIDRKPSNSAPAKTWYFSTNIIFSGIKLNIKGKSEETIKSSNSESKRCWLWKIKYVSIVKNSTIESNKEIKSNYFLTSKKIKIVLIDIHQIRRYSST